MNLTQRMWMIPLAHQIGMGAIVLGLYLIFTGQASPWWLLAWLLGHCFGALCVTVALHRYFTHCTFRTSKLWHTVMCFGSVLTVQGSPLGWAAAHTTHHTHSDTERDPHVVDISYLWHKKYRDVPMELWAVKRIIGDPTVQFVHRYATAIMLGYAALLYLIDPMLLVFGYLMPLGSTHLVGAVHQVISHRNGGARDLPWMEYILPAFGEWNHKYHHDHPGAWRMGNKPGELDLGARVIALIRTD